MLIHIIQIIHDIHFTLFLQNCHFTLFPKLSSCPFRQNYHFAFIFSNHLLIHIIHIILSPRIISSFYLHFIIKLPLYPFSKITILPPTFQNFHTSFCSMSCIIPCAMFMHNYHFALLHA